MPVDVEILRPEWPGDLICPHCSSELEWDDDRLTAFHWEKVQCGNCNKNFCVKLEIKKTYEVKK